MQRCEKIIVYGRIWYTREEKITRNMSVRKRKQIWKKERESEREREREREGGDGINTVVYQNGKER